MRWSQMEEQGEKAHPNHNWKHTAFGKQARWAEHMLMYMGEWKMLTVEELKVYYGFVIMKEMIKWIEMSTASKAAHTK